MQGAFTGCNKIFFLLGHYSLNISELTGSQYGYKHFYLLYFPGLFINDTQLVAGKIHVQFITGFMLYAHTGIYLCLPSGKVVFELAQAIAIGMFSPVFFP